MGKAPTGIKHVEKKVGLIAKAIAIMAVILLHVLSLFPDSIYTNADYNAVFVILNQAARFSVPLFLALSGFGLARKYQKKTLPTKKFIKSRLKKLVPLYLLWSLILLIILQVSNTWSSNGVNFWQGILLGKTDYHLYFVPLIFQLYFLFALLSKILPERHFIWLVVGTGLFQILLFTGIRLASLQELGKLPSFLLNDQIQYRILTNWLFYFSLGLFLVQINLKWLRKKALLGIILLVMIIGSLGWMVHDADQLISSTNNITYATSFIRPAVFLYATAVILEIIIYGPRLLQTIRWDFKILQTIGQHSYLIYLSHTLVLRIAKGVVTTEPRTSTLTMAGAFFVSGTILSGKLTS
jgi:surface polysaccharide O-acyltransferase-like enzyme